MRYLTDYVLRLYATPDYLDQSPPIASRGDLAKHTLMWFVDHRIDLDTLAQVREALGDHVQVQAASVGFLVEAVLGGVGIAPLPQSIAERYPSLVTVLPEIEFHSEYWLVIPRDLARLARTGAVVQVIDEIVAKRRAEITGRADADIAAGPHSGP